MPAFPVRVAGWLSQQVWNLECWRNRPFGHQPDRSASCRSLGASRDVLAGGDVTPRPELLVIVMTYGREQPCTELMASLTRSLEHAGLRQAAFLLVMEDPSDQPYLSSLALLEREWAGRFAFYRFDAHMGKRGRWLTYQRAFDVVHALQPVHTLFLEDDVSIGSSFVEQALAHWRSIGDPEKAVLSLCSFDDDEVRGRWIRFRRRLLDGGTIHLTQWFELPAFLAGPRFFEQLGYRLFAPPELRWRADPDTCSGVAQQFTRRMFGRGNVYQVVKTLAFHGRLPSVLNVRARQIRPLNNFPGEAS